MIESGPVADDLVVRSAIDIDGAALTEFHGRVFPGWPISRIWRWLYRSDTGGFPLVCLDGSRVIAHAGGIPFTARVGGRLFTAAWFVDFSVLPEYQRRGVGGRLTQAWMDQSELCVTFCNARSMAVFLRYGWTEAFPLALYSIWLRPFDHRRAVAVAGKGLRSAGNSAFALLARGWYAALTDRPADLATVGAETPADLVPQPPAGHETEITARRDAEYWSWRVAKSPDRERYRIYRGAAVTMWLSLSPKKRVDVLWMSGTVEAIRSEAPGMLASLAVWGLRNGFVSIRYRIPPAVPERAFRWLGGVATRPRFAFWTRDQVLRERLPGADWQWYLVDSDFEWL
jgi:GNAT superfamily N-acetyltransferase